MKKTFLTLLKTITLVIFVMSSGIIVAHSQSEPQLAIDFVDDTDFPNVALYTSFSDNQGFPIEGLLAENFSVAENTLPVSDITVEPVYQRELSIVLVIDVSESTGLGDTPTPIENTKQVVKDFLLQLGSDDQVAIITFAEDYNIEQDFTTNKQLLVSVVDALEPTKVYSNLHQALLQAYDLLELESGRRAVIAFTDSPDSEGGNIKIEKVIDEAVKKRVVVYPVIWRFEQPDLELLAELTNGEIQFLGEQQYGLQEFEAAVKNVQEMLDILRAQYLIKYVSQVPNDDLEHEVFVRVEYLGSFFEQRDVFVARTLGLNVSITNPPDGSLVGENSVIQVEAKSGAGIEKVDFYIDGYLVESDDSFPYEYKLDSVPEGNHQVKVEAFDENGLSDSDSISINVEFVAQVPPWPLIAAVAIGIAVLIPIVLRGRRGRARKKGGRAGGAVLVELEGNNPNREWPLGSSETRLGRKRSENDVHLKGLGASRRHGMIQYRQGEYVLFVHNPDNPILVNETPVTNQYVLRNGDVLRAGETVLRFEA